MYFNYNKKIMQVKSYKDVDVAFTNKDKIEISFIWKGNENFKIFVEKIKIWFYNVWIQSIQNKDIIFSKNNIKGKDVVLSLVKLKMNKFWFKTKDSINESENQNTEDLFPQIPREENIKRKNTFSKYRSITNSFHEDSLKYFIAKTWKEMEWARYEKIHGSNFSFVVLNDNTFEFYSREEEIKESWSFGWFQSIFKRIKENFLNAAEFIRKDRKDIVSIQFIGEIFWGSYPNIVVPNANKIQSWIFYCPWNDWRMFDILLNTEESNSYKNAEDYNAGRPFEDEYLSDKIVISIANTFDIPFIPEIARGNLEDILKINIEEVESVIYKSYGLPKIENNFVEGLVIKPIENCYSWSHRVIIKYKRKKFLEQKEKNTNKQPKEKIEISYSSELQWLINQIDNYLTENRIDSAKSKFPSGKEYIWKIIQNFQDDVKNDFYNDNNSVIEGLSNEEKNILIWEVRKQAAIFIRPFAVAN